MADTQSKSPLKLLIILGVLVLVGLGAWWVFGGGWSQPPTTMPATGEPPVQNPTEGEPMTKGDPPLGNQIEEQ